jgi:hypothetical protein
MLPLLSSMLEVAYEAERVGTEIFKGSDPPGSWVVGLGEV